MKTRIVPAIDLIDGKCVRLRQGEFSGSQVVAEDPLEMAKMFESQGFSRLHLVDLTGARLGAPRHFDVLELICSKTSLHVDFSGGLRTADSLRGAFANGAGQVVIGSAAVKFRDRCEEWFSDFGPERIILGLDIFEERVKVSGWEEDTPFALSEVISWYQPLGLKHLMSTDISRDGMLQGPAVDLYRKLTAAHPQLSIIASGGVARADDITVLADLGVSEIIVGKALYAHTIELETVREWIW